jgi:translation initiation factor 4G
MNVGLRRPSGRKIITNVSVNDEVQLKTTENAWKPGLKWESAIEDPDAQKTQVLLHFHSILINQIHISDGLM